MLIPILRNGWAIPFAIALTSFVGSTCAAENAPAPPSDHRRFPPSYMTTEGHKDVKPEDWTDPRICGQCHTLIGVSTESIEFDPDEGVHGSFSAPKIAETGVSCDVCHTISGTNLLKTAVLEHGNSSYVLDPSNTKRATLADAKSTYHETADSEHHAKSDFCGNCHNIFHPGNNFPIERTYDEWKYSIYAQKGIQCQDCHMVPVEIANKVADTMTRPEDMDITELEGFVGLGGPWRKFRHKNGFVGGNAVLTSVMQAEDPDSLEALGRQSNYEEAVKRLQSVASLKLEDTYPVDALKTASAQPEEHH